MAEMRTIPIPVKSMPCSVSLMDREATPLIASIMAVIMIADSLS